MPGDIPPAAGCIKNGGWVPGLKGLLLTEKSIGTALATRGLMTPLRDIGLPAPVTAPFGKSDRSRFLQSLDKLVPDAHKKKVEP